MENLWACQSLQVSTKAQMGQPLRTWHQAAYFLLKQSKYVLVDVRCNYKMLSQHKMLNQIFASCNMIL